MTFNGASVLPNNATPLEKSMALVAERLLRIEVPIRELWDPDKCPVPMLPYLAAAFSVDFWRADWDESKKRSVIRMAVRHHQMKGTLAGISAYAALAGSEVLSVRRAPLKFFAGASDTLEQRLAWLEGLPKVKIFRNVQPQKKRSRIYAGGAIKPFFLARRVAMPSTATVRSRQRAVLIEDSISQEIGVGFDADGYQTVHLRRSVGRRAFAGRFVGQVPVRSTASKQVARIAADKMAEHPKLARPLRPAGSGNGLLPTYGSEPKKIGRAFFAGARLFRRFAAFPTGYYRYFMQIALAGDLAPPEPRNSTAYASFTPLEMPAHTAELKVSMPGKSLRHGFFAGVKPAGSFANKVDKTRLGESFEAMRSAKALADCVLINSQTYRPFLAGQPHFAGQPILAGQMTRS